MNFWQIICWKVSIVKYCNQIKMHLPTLLTYALAITSSTAIDVYFTCPSNTKGDCCLFSASLRPYFLSFPSSSYSLPSVPSTEKRFKLIRYLGHEATKPANATHKHEWACLNNMDFVATYCEGDDVSDLARF